MAATDFASHVRPRLDQLSEVVSNEFATPSLSVETLLDTFLALYTDCKALRNKEGPLTNFLRKYEKLISRLQALRINTADFEIIKTLATGAVGKVCLVRYKPTKALYAMKILKKIDLRTRHEAQFFMEERNAMVFAKGSEWITTLYAAFQDEDNLYLVMEYASGGSLKNLMDSRENPFTEEEVRFYVAQILVALDELHKHNFVHRDVKPENCLIDQSGHLKLADFGSCIRMIEGKIVVSDVTVGTPEYISPEILSANENSTYGSECDWWSLGILMYDLLFDETPFYEETTGGMYGRILDHESQFAFPPEAHEVSEEARDLMRRLICDRKIRLGRNGAQEIQSHPWFAGIDWSSVRTMTPPFVPELNGPDDTRYFDGEQDESKKLPKPTPSKGLGDFTGQHLPFVGYTYVQNAIPTVSWRAGGQGVDWRPPTITKRASSRSLEDSDSLRQQLLEARQTAEEETRKLRQQLNDALSKQSDLQKTVNVLEKKKEMQEKSLEQLRASTENEAREREDMHKALSQLRKSLDEETGEKAVLERTKETNMRLEKEVDSLRAQIRQTSEDLKRQANLAADAEQAKAVIETELGLVKAKIQEDQNARVAVEVRMAALADELEKERKIIAEQRIAQMQLQQKNGHLDNELQGLQAALRMHVEEKEELTHAKLSLEQQIAATNAEKASLESTIAELRNKQKTASTQGGEIAALQEKIKEAQQKIGELIKTAASSGVEMAETKKRIQTEVQAHNGTKQMLKEAQELGQQQQQQLISAQQQLAAEKQKLTADLHRETAARSEAQRKLTVLESQVTAMTKDLESTKAELSKMTRSAQHAINYEGLYFEAQCSIEELHKQLTDGRDKMKAMTERTNQLQEEVERLKLSMESGKREMEKAQLKCSEMTVDYEALQQRYETEQQLRKELQTEIDGLNRGAKAREECLQKETLRADSLEDSCEDALRRADELDVQCTLLKTREQNLADRVHELEQTCAALHNQIDAEERASRLGNRTSKSSDSLRSESLRSDQRSSKSPEKRTKGGWKNMLFRGNSQPLKFDHGRSTSVTPATPATPGTPLSPEDDSTKILDYGLHRRPSAASSVFSFKSSLTTKGSDFFAVEFNPREGLKGWLKVPKGGRVKKGWRQRYAVVRDFKIYMYDRDKDVGTMEGSFIVDIRSDIFVVKPVAQNELIHASAKDIDCIFKIQAVNKSIANVQARQSSTDHNEISSVQRRIQKLEGDMGLEEQMLQAAQKMWTLSSEANRVTLNAQIEASQNRLRVMRLELDRQRTLLHSSQESSSAPQTANHSAEAIDEDIGYYRKKLETQLGEEQKKREAVVKVAIAAGKGENIKAANPDAPANSVEHELAVAERNISRIKEDIESLDSNDQGRISAVLRRIKEAVEKSDTHGHAFKLRQYYKPTDCAACHEPLWGNQNQGFECNACKLICHKTCRGLIDLSCEETRALKTVQPLYFMAQDTHDRARWLAGLEYYKHQTTNPTTPSRLPHSKSLASIHIPVSPLEIPGLSPTNSIKHRSMMTQSPSRGPTSP